MSINNQLYNQYEGVIIGVITTLEHQNQPVSKSVAKAILNRLGWDSETIEYWVDYYHLED